MAVGSDPFDGQDHSGDVVVYKSIVRFSVEQSSLWLNPRFTDEDRRQILVVAPLRLNFKGRWPPALTADNGRNLHLLTYRRLAAGLAVRSNTRPDISAEEIRQTVYRHEPAFDPAMHETDRGRFDSYKMSVAITERGEHTLTILKASTGQPLPGCDAKDPRTRLPAIFKNFQQLVEADLVERADLLLASTDSFMPERR